MVKTAKGRKMINYRVKLNNVRGELHNIEKQIKSVRKIASQFSRERSDMSFEIDKERISETGYVNVNFNIHLLRMLSLNEERHQILQNIATQFAVQLTTIFECMNSIEKEKNFDKDYLIMVRYLLININAMMSETVLNEMPRDAIGILITKALFKYEDSDYPDILRLINILREIKNNLCTPVIPE